MVSPDKFALVQRWGEELSPEEIAERYMADADVVVCEGFKRSALPKIEIFRSAAGAAPLYDPSSPQARHYLAIVTDVADIAGEIPVILLSDPVWLESVADLVERRVMAERVA
jgi:molybdopterin-guanine dinucleotide biosynthesis protein B